MNHTSALTGALVKYKHNYETRDERVYHRGQDWQYGAIAETFFKGERPQLYLIIIRDDRSLTEVAYSEVDLRVCAIKDSLIPFDHDHPWVTRHPVYGGIGQGVGYAVATPAAEPIPEPPRNIPNVPIRPRRLDGGELPPDWFNRPLAEAQETARNVFAADRNEAPTPEPLLEARQPETWSAHPARPTTQSICRRRY